MRTKEPDYDTKPDFGTLVDKHRQLPLKRFMDLIGSKLDDLNDLLLKPTPYDQGPGRIEPYSIPVLYGPIPLTTAGRAGDLVGQDGFQAQAALADPAKFIIPRGGDIIISRNQSVRIYSMSAYGFVNWGYTENPGFVVPSPVIDARGVGDIFDNVINANGGAMPLDYFGGTFSTLSTPQPNLPNIAFEVELYDRIRGRRMHDKRLPSEMFQGGRIGHRKTGSLLSWEQGSKIEPRVFIKEARMGSVLDGADAFEAASVKVWLVLLFKGTAHLEAPNV